MNGCWLDWQVRGGGGSGTHVSLTTIANSLIYAHRLTGRVARSLAWSCANALYRLRACMTVPSFVLIAQSYTCNDNDNDTASA